MASFPRRLPVLLSALLGAAVAWAVPASRLQPANAPTISLAELHAGQQGEVWTVFQGTQPEPFAVQVTGVVENAVGPGKSLILCELTDPRVQSMGAVAGMSGSPLYVEGRFAGALSYQIQRFETTHFAGFTPAGDLEEVRDHRAGPEAAPFTPAPAPGGAGRRAAEPLYQSIRPTFTVSGLSSPVLALLAPRLRELGIDVSALGGSTNARDAAAPPPPPLVGGSAVAVALATGDVSIAGTGTVARVDGNRVTAFGHPMVGLGDVQFPMCSADILTILPSTMQSIKVANTGRVIGTFDQDRLTGVAGNLGAGPAMTRVAVTMQAGGRVLRQWNFSVARHEMLTAPLVATGITQAILGTNEAGFNRGFRLTTEVNFGPQQSLATHSLYTGPQGFAQGLNDFVKDLTVDLQNPYEKTYPSQVAFTVEPLAESPAITLETFQISRTSAHPGDTLTATIGWRDFQGAAQTASVDIPVPAEWTGKLLEVVLTGGPALDELSGRPRSLIAAQLRSFGAYLDAVRDERSADSLYLCVAEKSSFFTDESAATPEMPASIERIARRADETRFRTRDALLPLWEKKVLPGKIMTTTARRSFTVIE